MGRLTWESLPVKPLPSRANIVVSANGDYWAFNIDEYGQNRDCGDLEDAVVFCRRWPHKECFLIGGQSIFAEGIRLADTVYLTRVDTWVPTDETARYFPTEYLVERFTHTETTGTAIGNINGKPVSCEFQTWKRS